MSKKELYKGKIIAQVQSSEITQKKAAQKLKLSIRQIKRLCKKYRANGIEGLSHQNRGKSSPRKIDPDSKKAVLELIKNQYPDFGPQLIKEQLEERDNIRFSREWIRRLMIEEEIWKPKKRKNLILHQRRARRPQEGELIQIDGRPEFWFEDRDKKCCLINMVDDATGKLMELRFVENECLEGYFQSMKKYIKLYGRPLAVYSDRHTIFKSPKSEEKPNLTQFGRAMKELEIELIFANSPQAKGRVERSHGVLQDRLIKLMRLDGISSIDEGNKYLEQFRVNYNQRFGRLPRSPENAHQELAKGSDLDRILCRKEPRKISKSLIVQYNHSSYQLIPKMNSRRLVGKNVLVSEVRGKIIIDSEGEEYDYTVYNEQPYAERVMNRKDIDSYLDKKKPMSIIERQRRGISVNF